MIKIPKFSSWMAAGLMGLALAASWAADARADIAYGFATQTISGLTITPTITPGAGGVVTSTQNNTTLNGAGSSTSNPLDAPQVFQGGGPPAPENFFARYAPGNPPVSPTGNFTRADSAIPVLSGPGNTSSVVSESYLNSASAPPATTETGGAQLTASLTFTVPNTTALTINYNYSNQLFGFVSGAATASANFKFNITIKDATTGAIVFSSSPTPNNTSIAVPPPGNEIVTATGPAPAIITPVLNAGTQYSLVFSSSASTSVALTPAVPEPGSMSLVAMGGVLTLGVGMLRRRKARNATK